MSQHRNAQEVTLQNVDEEDVTFRIQPFPPTLAWDYQPDILDLLRGPITGILDGLDVSGLTQGQEAEIDPSDASLDLSALSPSIESLASFMRERGDSKWVMKFLASTYVVREDGQKDQKLSNLATFNQVFMADMMLLAQVVFHVVKVNYGASLGNLLGGLDQGSMLKSLQA